MAELNSSATATQQSNVEKLYFAYGSNMYLKQMSDRCPDSTLFSIGIIRGFRWHINSRGGANIAQGNYEDFVEGIVFTVSPRDIEALRRYERIAENFFVESEVEFEVGHFLNPTLEGQKTVIVAQALAQGRAECVQSSFDFGGQGQRCMESEICRQVKKGNTEEKNPYEDIVIRKALVYVILESQVPGIIRDEYVSRMKLAISDASMLGVSQKYLTNSLHTQIFGTKTGAK